MIDAIGEVRLALRGLRKAPAFALTAVGTLGLAIGASAAIFALVDSILLTPLPYSDPDRLVMLRYALREEMRAMRAIPSLPATEVARTSWSPN